MSTILPACPRPDERHLGRRRRCGLIETDGERIASFGPVLTVAYADDVRRLIRAAFGAEQPNEATAPPSGR